MSYDPSKVAFVDTETTGLDPERHEVWEVAVIVDGVEHCWLQEYSGTPDAWVLENTRLAVADFGMAMTQRRSIQRFNDLTRGRHLIGACPWFDSDRLHRQHLRRVGIGSAAAVRSLPWHYHLVDVENLAVGYLAGRYAQLNGFAGPVEFPWSSESLSLLLGVDPADFQPKHSALADARWAKAMFEAIVGSPVSGSVAGERHQA